MLGGHLSFNEIIAFHVHLLTILDLFPLPLRFSMLSHRPGMIFIKNQFKET